MVSAADSLLKYLNYCLHEELLSLEELTSVGQALSEGDVMSDASLLSSTIMAFSLWNIMRVSVTEITGVMMI